MSDHNSFDERLASWFEREHRHVADDAFVVHTMRKIRAQRLQARMVRHGLRAALLVAMVVASPWLIATVERMSSALESSLTWASGLPGAGIVGGLAIATFWVTRVRRR